MRLGSLPDPIPRGGEAGTHERHHAALAVGPANERAAELALGVAEGGQQRPGPAQPQADPEPAARLERGNRPGEGGREVVALRPAHEPRSSS
jgi:hypothetical protein